MKVIMADATSLDGKLTRGNESDVTEWTSLEDQQHFAEIRKHHNLIVIGRGTYEAIKPIPASAGKLRVVVTRHPEKYQTEAIPGSLEFSSESPTELVIRLEKEGYSKMLMLGGGEINGQFLAAGVVDELYLTLEPKLFGEGTNLAGSHILDVDLDLIDMKKLNEKGTLLLHYRVKK